MTRIGSALAFVTSICLLAPDGAGAQGGWPMTSITGLVTDDSGQVVGAAVVTVTRTSAASAPTVVQTGRSGRFAIDAIEPGIYELRITAPGFREMRIVGIDARAATPVDLRIVLRRGSGAPADVVVSAATTVAGAPSARAPAVFDAEALARLPLLSQNAVTALAFLPGVSSTTTIARDATFFGLPAGAVTLTLDGVNEEDDLFRSAPDQLAARVRPIPDFLSSVVMTGPVVDATEAGPLPIQFVTRAGSDAFAGSAFDAIRSRAFDSNTFLNSVAGLPRNADAVQQGAGWIGGPIPGLARGRAYVFAGWFDADGTIGITRDSTILTPLAASGIFTDGSAANASAPSQVDVLSAPGAPRLTIDPAIASILDRIHADRLSTGVTLPTANPNTLDYRFENTAHDTTRQPAARVDVRLGARQWLVGSFDQRVNGLAPDLLSDGDAPLPGFDATSSQHDTTSAASLSWRVVGRSGFANDLTIGAVRGDADFPGPTADAFAFEHGVDLDFNIFPSSGGLTSPTVGPWSTSRQDDTWTVDEALHWLKGAHHFTFGGSASGSSVTETQQPSVPVVAFGEGNVVSGASLASINDQGALRALLLGDVTSARTGLALDESTNSYQYLGTLVQRLSGGQFAVFAQDDWHAGRNLTVAAGLRWTLAPSITTGNDAFFAPTTADFCGVSGLGAGPGGRFCNIFVPGNETTVTPVVDHLAAGSPLTAADWTAIAPSIAVAWQPGILPDATARAGFSIAHQQDGLGDVYNLYAANTGGVIAGGVPLCVNDLDDCRLSSLGTTPPAFTAPVTAVSQTVASPSLNLAAPNLRLPSVRAWTAGLERSVGAHATVSVSYVGTRGIDQWTVENWNEIDVVQNGFLAEFESAQANLAANVAAGRGPTFAYEGPGTATVPLPIFFRYLQVQPSTLAGNAKGYTSPAWSSVAFLSPLNPNPVAEATAINVPFDVATAGIAANFFEMNPAATQANVMTNDGRTAYDALQVSWREAVGALHAQATFTASRGRQSEFDTIARAPAMVVSPATVPRLATVLVGWDVPYGHGLRFGTNAPRWLDAVAGHWSIDLVGRIQSGPVLTLSGIRLVGMTPADLQRAFAVRVDPVTKLVYDLPQDIIDNTIRAFSTDPTTATGYGPLGPPTGRYLAPASTPGCVEVYPGDCGEPHDLVIDSPIVSRIDLAMRKTWPLRSRTSLVVEFDVFNVFAAAGINPVLQASASPGIDQITSAYQDAANTDDPGGRVGQLVVRVRW